MVTLRVLLATYLVGGVVLAISASSGTDFVLWAQAWSVIVGLAAAVIAAFTMVFWLPSVVFILAEAGEFLLAKFKKKLFATR